MAEHFAIIRHQHIVDFDTFSTEIEAEDWARPRLKKGGMLAPLDLAPGERPSLGARVRVDRLGIAAIVKVA
jgi:hypothetical protein